MSSGLRTPCSLPLTIRASAAFTSSPSLLRPPGCRAVALLVEIVFELLATAWMPEFSEGLGLDLPDPLSRDTKPLPYLF